MQAALLRSAKSSAGAVGAIAKFTVFTSATGFETRCDGWPKGLKDTKDTHEEGLKCIFCSLKRRNCAMGFWEGGVDDVKEQLFETIAEHMLKVKRASYKQDTDIISLSA